MIQSYNDLLVWKRSIELVEEVYKLTRYIPKEETYGLISQMRRSAISIPSNIAEGQQRRTTKDFISFLYIARGSNAELKTQCLICIRLHFLSKEQCQKTVSLSDEIGKMLSKMIASLSDNNE
ncbi:MAG: four helix bundle protein [Ruminococcus sp.]|nr:four helix bundle protein [Ruminococcus sp.]